MKAFTEAPTRAYVLTCKKRKVYELIPVILNKPRLNYNTEEK
jgi:hypothetical protein